MAWKHIKDELKDELVEARNASGLQRQNELAQDFSKLIELIQQKKHYPFDDLSELMQSLEECCESFRQGGHWQYGDICENRYFYRVENFESFMCKHRRFLHETDNDDYILFKGTDENEPNNIEADSIEGNYKLLCERYEHTYKWQPVENLTTQYIGRRGISWWTNDFIFEKEGELPQNFIGDQLSKENRWVLDFAFKVGISSDWLSDHLLFLRLDSTKVERANIRIPSIIDALTQPIFSPQQFDEQSRWGKAFNLNGDVKPYYREYVIKQAPVDAIDYIPVRINTNTLDDININARLYDSLVLSLIKNI